jgi:hypothetical protein
LNILFSPEQIERAEVFVRTSRTSWDFYSNELLELELLFDELNRTNILVYRTFNSNFDSYKNLELSSQIVNWTVNFARRAELNKQFCSTNWLEYQVLFELEFWTSSDVLTLRLSFGFCSSDWVGLKKRVRTQLDGYTSRDVIISFEESTANENWLQRVLVIELIIVRMMILRQ